MYISCLFSAFDRDGLLVKIDFVYELLEVVIYINDCAAV